MVSKLLTLNSSVGCDLTSVGFVMWSGGECLELGQGQISGQVSTEAERLNKLGVGQCPFVCTFVPWVRVQTHNAR